MNFCGENSEIHQQCFFSNAIQFWLIYFVEPTTVHSSSSRNFKIFYFGGKYGLFGVKTVKFTKNASSPSGISGIPFWSIYFVDLTTLHNSSSRNFKILNFVENNGLVVVKMVKFTKNASSPSVVNGIQFWSIYFVDPTTVHNSSSQNFKTLILGKICTFGGENSEIH